MPIAANSRRFLIGIDPGLSGGIAVLDGSGELCNAIAFEKLSNHEIAEWLERYAASGFPVKAALEKVGAMPGQGVCAMFTFGTSYGFLQGLLAAHKVSYIDVTPQKWQKRLGIPPKQKEATKTEFKRLLQAKAHQRWPHKISEITKAVADAALIAEYLRLEEIGK